MIASEAITLAGTSDSIEAGTPEQLAALYGALAEAQAGFAAVHRSRTVTIKTQQGPSYSFSYAPLEDLLAATRPALNKNGLAVLTPIVSRDGLTATVLATIVHKAGGRIGFGFTFKAQGAMKDIGGQITYARRYAYSAVLNLAADDDEDDAQDTDRQQAPPRQAAPRGPTKAEKYEARSQVIAEDEMIAAQMHAAMAQGKPMPSVPAPLGSPLALPNGQPSLGPAIAPAEPRQDTLQAEAPTAEDITKYDRGLELGGRLGIDLAPYERRPELTRRQMSALAGRLKQEIDRAQAALTTA